LIYFIDFFLTVLGEGVEEEDLANTGGDYLTNQKN